MNGSSFGRCRDRSRDIGLSLYRISRPAGGISYAVALEDRFAPVAQYDRPDDRVGPVRDRQPDRKHQPETYLRGCFRSDDQGDLPRSGYEFANRLLINNIYYRYLNLDNLTDEETDFKSRLIEWCQKTHHTIAFETVHGRNYSSNHPIFDATVVIDGIRVGHGQGESKKEAEQCAAHSVSCAMSDEACGDILDKIDRLYQPKGTGVS